MINAILVSVFLFQTLAFSDAPGESGVWLLRDGNRLPMQPATVAQASARGLDNYVFTGGYTNLDMDVSFAGPSAALRISGREPVFIAYLVEGGYEPMLIRLEKKKDRRICRVRSSSASTNNRQGFRRQDIVRTILAANPDKSFTVRPERPLKPGEYLIVTGSPSLGRDFGVD
jgi:hypothetical protein